MDAEGEAILTVCLLGGTGTGKSSTCNTLFGCRSNDVFPVSHGTASATCRPQVAVLPWRGTGRLVRCVDVPGLGHTSGHDRQRVGDTVEALRGTVREVHLFLLLLNSQAPRFDIHQQEMLTQFRQALGVDFLRHLMIGFSRWDFRPSASRRRQRRCQTEAWKASVTNKELRSLLGHDFDCPCVFLDNSLNALSDADLEQEFWGELPDVLHAFEAELQKVLSFMCGRRPFQCRELRPAAAFEPRPLVRTDLLAKLTSPPQGKKVQRLGHAGPDRDPDPPTLESFLRKPWEMPVLSLSDWWSSPPW